jgi:hypothetical protein
MHTLRKSLLLAGAAATLATASFCAQAQQGEGRYTHAAAMQERGARMAEHFAARQARLHDALKLSAAQEPAWTTYQNALQPHTPPAHPDRAAWQAMSAPARMQAMIDLTKQRTAMMEQRLPAVTAFYDQLTPEQKQVYDRFTRHHGRGGRDGHGRHHQGMPARG